MRRQPGPQRAATSLVEGCRRAAPCCATPGSLLCTSLHPFDSRMWMHVDRLTCHLHTRTCSEAAALPTQRRRVGWPAQCHRTSQTSVPPMVSATPTNSQHHTNHIKSCKSYLGRLQAITIEPLQVPRAQRIVPGRDGRSCRPEELLLSRSHTMNRLYINFRHGVGAAKRRLTLCRRFRTV